MCVLATRARGMHTPRAPGRLYSLLCADQDHILRTCLSHNIAIPHLRRFSAICSVCIFSAGILYTLAFLCAVYITAICLAFSACSFTSLPLYYILICILYLFCLQAGQDGQEEGLLRVDGG